MIDDTDALKKRLDRYKRELKCAVNELCLKCGDYEREHLGACDECKYKEMRSGDLGGDQDE